jgi:hypothetical protein
LRWQGQVFHFSQDRLGLRPKPRLLI